jgi:hypothetical protein
MTTPPNFGGREIEKGREEDLGLPHQEHTAADHADIDPAAAEDNEAHAPGATCARCGALIGAGQDVRRRADGQWVHEVCP